ncbi:asparagine synthase-related protein [Sphingomonas soli]|uniref:asparagine synthase-related protein n=1 Tax=Sphingomonas soli TaxID=266127 RepID=UPI0008314779|nr:asparagine synthase C-terminal domain-containing protein [Sphingomonas soli]
MSRPGFLALIHARAADLAPVRASAARLGLAVIVDNRALTYLASPDLPVALLPDDAGVLIGHAFARSGRCAAPAPETLIHYAATAKAGEIVNAIWGGYLLIRTGAGPATVLRDPSGAVSCYHAPLTSGRAIASDAALLAASGLIAPVIAWEQVASTALHVDARSASTALSPIEELLPGTELCLDRRLVRPVLHWKPSTHLVPLTHDFGEAAALVREAALASIGAWGARFARPLLQLSGGLDSSIVAAGLGRASIPAQCMTFRGRGSDLDEVRYAKVVADHFGFPLHPLAPDPSDIDLSRSAAAALPRPHARSFAQVLDRLSLTLAREIHADAFFSGAGGDDVFCYQGSVLPAIDRLALEGWRGFDATLRDLSTLREVAYWDALRKAAKRYLYPRPTRAWFRQTAFLTDQCARDTPDPAEHAWNADCRDALPGKRAHVAGLVRIHNFLEAHEYQAHAPLVCPLLAQPLVEACLGVPSWLWCAGGRNRAVARAAFTDILPETILARRAKGSFDGFAARLVEDRRGALRELLCDGLLAEHRIVDRAAVATRLDAAAPVPGDDANRLLDLADIEAWARSWHRD